MKPSGWKITNGTERAWASTMPLTESVPLTITTPTRARPSTSSYDTTWAPPRSAPSKEYFEPLDQPPNTTPYTPSELAPIRYTTATGMSWITSGIWKPPRFQVGPMGMTAKAARAAIKEITGASGYRTRSAIAG